MKNGTQQAKKKMSGLVLLTFAEYVNRIVESQIEWEPGQNGRWDVTYLEDGTPRIAFSGFADGTVLALHSLNGNTVKLGLEAAALAISQCAMNWVMFHAFEQERHDIGRQADRFFHRLTSHIHHSRKSNVTSDEKRLIYRFND